METEWQVPEASAYEVKRENSEGKQGFGYNFVDSLRQLAERVLKATHSYLSTQFPLL